MPLAYKKIHGACVPIASFYIWKFNEWYTHPNPRVKTEFNSPQWITNWTKYLPGIKRMKKKLAWTLLLSWNAFIIRSSSDHACVSLSVGNDFSQGRYCNFYAYIALFHDAPLCFLPLSLWLALFLIDVYQIHLRGQLHDGLLISRLTVCHPRDPCQRQMLPTNF